MSVIDLIIRIKNGYLAKREEIHVPFSKFRESVLRKLVDLGYVTEYQIYGESIKHMVVKLKYESGVPAMTDVRIWSTSGRRMYKPYKELSSVKGGMGHAIISSSKGIVTDREAKKSQVGGELLFYIW